MDLCLQREDGTFKVARMTLPALRLGGHLLNKLGKAYSIVSQIYLVNGRSWDQMALFIRAGQPEVQPFFCLSCTVLLVRFQSLFWVTLGCCSSGKNRMRK